MSLEGQIRDQKSLRAVIGNSADWKELAKDCVAFANSVGGKLIIGIEDGEHQPPEGQKIPAGLTDIIRKRMGELTVGLTALPQVLTSEKGAEFIELSIPRSTGVASTSGGRYFIRVGDESKPVNGDDIMRLANERSAIPWETQTTTGIERSSVDTQKLDRLLSDLRASDRVKPSVKEKTVEELLDHYLLTDRDFLTNLGVLCIGTQSGRAKLGSAPVVQFIKFDETGQKVNKIVWDDYTLSPMELVSVLWRDVPDFRERYELPDGLFRQDVPAFDEVVVRELLVNALVHRPYTQRGDIFLNLHPDRLEITNPGQLPLGVTPKNVLHTTVRRNEHLARLFHDLKLMEREGSGFDRVYEVLLSQGRPAPVIFEGTDSVTVIVRRRILKPEVIDFIAKADQTFFLTQRERIALGVLAQTDALSARELCAALELQSLEALQPWIKRIADWGLVKNSGKTQATKYFVDPILLQTLNFAGAATTLKRIEPHRLAALIEEDVRRYPRSQISDIHRRVGAEIPRTQIKRSIAELVKSGRLLSEGIRRGTRYSTP